MQLILRHTIYLNANNSNLNHTYVVLVKFSSFPNNKQQILDSSKLKEFADDNFKFDENGRKFSKRVENTVGKEEIAHYEQFLLLPQRFQKTCTADTKNQGLFGKGLGI